MNVRKLSFGESLRVIGKAIKISVKTKSAASVIVSVLGFAAAFLPMLISLKLSDFSNRVQGLFGKGTSAITGYAGPKTVFCEGLVMTLAAVRWR